MLQHLTIASRILSSVVKRSNHLRRENLLMILRDRIMLLLHIKEKVDEVSVTNNHAILPQNEIAKHLKKNC